MLEEEKMAHKLREVSWTCIAGKLSELIDLMASQQGQLTNKDVELAVKLMIDHMAESLASGERIEIRGFGSFSLHYREPRKGRNPKTGEDIPISARRVVTFRPGQKLKARVEAYAGTGE